MARETKKVEKVALPALTGEGSKEANAALAAMRTGMDASKKLRGDNQKELTAKVGAVIVSLGLYMFLHPKEFNADAAMTYYYGDKESVDRMHPNVRSVRRSEWNSVHGMIKATGGKRDYAKLWEDAKNRRTFFKWCTVLQGNPKLDSVDDIKKRAAEVESERAITANVGDLYVRFLTLAEDMATIDADAAKAPWVAAMVQHYTAQRALGELRTSAELKAKNGKRKMSALAAVLGGSVTEDKTIN